MPRVDRGAAGNVWCLKNMFCLVLFSLCLRFWASWCSRVAIEDNGYTGVLVALPGNLEDSERLILNVEDMFRSSSEILQLSTKGRAHFAEVSFLVPDSWNVRESDLAWDSPSFNASTFSEAGAAVAMDEADVVITEAGQYPYVLHQSGCGRRARRIVLPKGYVLDRGEKGFDFARLWSEYRYGVFPEGGFGSDDKYPFVYSMPGRTDETVTGCSDDRFRISSLCNKYGKGCEENSTSSLMDQHQPHSAKLFCEGHVGLGPRHDPEPPSKHNLLCREEGTWFTVMRSTDFARGKNAAPRRLQDASAVSFRFVRQNTAPKVIIAVETSSRMSQEFRFLLTKSPLYRFLYSTLPDGSEVTLFLFGGDGGVTMERHRVVLEDGESKLHFIESQPLPEDVSETETSSLEQLFDAIFQVTGNRSDARAADIVVVTTASHANATADIQWRLSESDSRLHVMQFVEDEEEATLYRLCQETGGHFTSLHADAFGDMHRGFGNVLGTDVLIHQDYLKEDDDVDLEVPFVLDESLTQNLKVYLSFPIADVDDLQYRKTTLQTPSGGHLNFLKMQMLNAWIVQLAKPQAGEYVLKTRRVEDSSSSVLMTVSGSPSPKEDPITVNVWTETVLESEVIPAPVQIFAEVRKGWYPVAGAQVVATVRHPDDATSQRTLLDDGLGDVDITRNDGIYGGYFTTFTSPGYYNVYVKVTRGLNGTDVLTGSDDFCCGSSFPTARAHPVGDFQREAGPFTFRVPWFDSSSNAYDFPPSRVTDLRLGDLLDRICVVQWTAAGEDYDAGFASTYELKVFRDSVVVRHRFSDSGQELYSETIQATPEAAYGVTLNHAFQLPSDVKRGLYYIAVRAVDKAGNAGEPSNAVPVWIEESSPKTIDCENDAREELPRTAKLRSNDARSLGVAFTFISANVLISILASTLSLSSLHAV